MQVKEQIRNIRNSELVQDSLGKIQPTWHVIKNEGGYKIILISLLITFMFAPINAVIGVLSKILLSGSVIGTITLTGLIRDIMSGYVDSGAILITIGLFILSGIISFLTFIITTFVVSNANFRAFRVLSEEERVVSIGEYFKLAFSGLIPYSVKMFTNVIFPLFIINMIGKAVNIIPYVRGKSIASFIIAIASYALIFRFIAKLLELDHDEVVSDFSAYWLTFAVVVYLVKVATSLTILVTLLQMSFVLFTILLLTRSRHYYGE